MKPYTTYVRNYLSSDRSNIRDGWNATGKTLKFESYRSHKAHLAQADIGIQSIRCGSDRCKRIR